MNQPDEKPSLNSLVSLEEMAAALKMKPEALRDLTASGHIPHYTYCGTGPWFHPAAVKKWVKDYLLEAHGGMPIPKRAFVLEVCHTLPERSPPTSIRGVEGLCYFGLPVPCSGVYFLCEKDEVVYVGQALSVMSRIGEHIREGVKVFDMTRVFFLPCPASALNQTEQGFIKLLDPKYNRRNTKVIEAKPAQ